MAIDFFKIGQAAAPSSVDISKAVKEGLAEGLKPIQEYEKSRKQRIEALGRILQQTPNLDQLPKITAQYKQPIMDWAMGKKKEFSDAAAVLVQASPESQEYRDAIQKINSVNSAFQNLDNNLKNIQAERKEYLEDLRSGNISDAFQNSDIEHFGDDKSYSVGINYLMEGKHEIAVGISTSDSNTDDDKLSSSGYYMSYYMHF